MEAVVHSSLSKTAPRHGEEPSRSDFRALSKCDRVINVDAEVANGILDVGVTQRDLHSPQVARRFLDKRSLCTTHRKIGRAHV